MLTEVVFDVETQKLFSDITTDDPADLLISVVSAYRRIVDDHGNEQEGEMKSFWHPSASLAPTVDALWEWFEEADRIIGFNSKKFDVPALRPHYPKDLTKLPHFDMLELVKISLGRRISLNALADATIGGTKTDVGTNAVYYWANRTPENIRLLQSYCEADVLLTRDLYDYGRREKHLKYLDTRTNQITKIDIDFSYPRKREEAQIGLF